MKFYGIKAPMAKRVNSTSGGIFQLVAEKFICDGGVVFGAGYDDGLGVVYKKVTSYEGLQAILGSKYVEASIEGVFDDILSTLSEGKKVLFVGSPCTVSALKSFVASKNDALADSLFLIDFVCSGVPEKGFWEAYLRYLENALKKRLSADSVKLTAFKFRDKVRPDSAHTVSWDYDYRRPGCALIEHGHDECGFIEDRFCRIYTKTISLQKRCFQCKWCSLDRPGDLSIGDYWGVQKYHPSFDDGYGVSLCIVNDDKGETVIRDVLRGVEYIELDESEIMQPRLSSPNKVSIINTLFRKDLFANGEPGNCDMDLILKKYGN